MNGGLDSIINFISRTNYYVRRRISCHHTPRLLNNYSNKPGQLLTNLNGFIKVIHVVIQANMPNIKCPQDNQIKLNQSKHFIVVALMLEDLKMINFLPQNFFLSFLQQIVDYENHQMSKEQTNIIIYKSLAKKKIIIYNFFFHSL